MIKKISKIKDHVIFRDFKWKSDLPEFKIKNVIYGWNGSGKTTLSNLFRSLEKKRNISEGEIEFLIGNRKVFGSDIEDDPDLPNVKVFNKDFIKDTVFSESGDIAPIYYVAEGSRIIRREIKKLGKEVDANVDDIEKKREAIEKTGKDISSLLVQNANDLVKRLLRSSGTGNPYNTYNKSNFESKLIELQKLDSDELEKKILSEDEIDVLRDKKDTKSKDPIPDFELPFSDLSKHHESVNKVLKETVVSKTLKELEEDQELSSWIRTGLKIHQEREADQCLFCNNSFEESRKSSLEEHFNDAYNNFLKELDQNIDKLKSISEQIRQKSFIQKSDFYDHLYGDFEQVKAEFEKEKNKFSRYLNNLGDALEEKRGKPFKPMTLSISLIQSDIELCKSVEQLIGKHNQITENLDSEIKEARKKIEESIAAKKVGKYSSLKEKKSKLKEEVNKLTEQNKTLKSQIDKLNEEISEHRKPASELNDDLESYLGRKELVFEPFESGYRIKRGEEDARNLSEGERTAIAFLYFLKSINDENFKSQERIVVIDDPISSLDSNSIFHAFGFMKERTEDIDQLFILTHNHAFFRQVKNWFSSWDRQRKRMNHPEKANENFYMLNLIKNESERSSEICEMDKLLYKYDSEYHYLFSIIKKGSDSDGEALEYYYHFPNIARRLLESFLAFKKPQQAYDLKKALNTIRFDIVKKTKILRFLHANSHNDFISEPEHDHSILSETPAVLKDLLDLIETVDEDHYKEMLKCVA